MTNIQVRLVTPGPGGTYLPAVGDVQWTPTRRLHIESPEDAIVLPVPVTLPLVNGEASIEVEANDGTWCWKVRERTPGGTVRFVDVPEAVDTLDYGDLVDVDPASLDPAADPVAIWWEELAALTVRVEALEAGSITLPEDLLRGVLVATGAEARPDVPTDRPVFWIGDDERPANMGPVDIHFDGSDVVTPDTEDPSTPENLVASDITESGFTVTCDASTDNVGVTNYNWYLDDVFYDSSFGPSQDFAGLTADTVYDVTVEAEDAADNVSALSAALPVTTDEAPVGLPTHKVFATAPATPARTVESEPRTYATGFYTFGGTVTGWKVKGASFWIPAGVTVPASVEVNLYVPAANTAPDLATPLQTVTLSGLVAGQWNAVNFSAATVVTGGQVFYIGSRFSDNAWLGATAFSDGFVQASDGAALVLSDREPSVGQVRNYSRIGTGSTLPLTGAERDYWLNGVDAIVEEAA